jgi:uncharacterized protein involved in exopolysaccharide biosynthesis
MTREPTPSDYLRSAKPHLGRAAIVIVAGTVLSAVLAFVWPPTYRAETVLLPPTEEETGFSISTVIRGLNVPGVRIPSRTGPEDVTMAILQSRRLAAALVQRFDLMRVYSVPRKEPAIRILRSNSSFRLGESGTVVVRVEDRDPQRAADLANAYAEELDRFNKEIRMTKGRQTRLFVEKRLEETRVAMQEAEEALRRYGEEHHTVVLSADQMSSVESAASLFATQANLEIQLGIARQSASESSVEVRRLRQQLAEVNRLIRQLPDLGLEQARLVRTVKIQEQVFALLSSQYEEARINEARDLATVEVLDRAERPDRRAWPRRGLLMGLGFLISSFVAAVGVAWSVQRTGVEPASERALKVFK